MNIITKELHDRVAMPTVANALGRDAIHVACRSRSRIDNVVGHATNQCCREIHVLTTLGDNPYISESAS
jgi:hypothetical protein